MDRSDRKKAFGTSKKPRKQFKVDNSGAVGLNLVVLNLEGSCKAYLNKFWLAWSYSMTALPSSPSADSGQPFSAAGCLGLNNLWGREAARNRMHQCRQGTRPGQA